MHTILCIFSENKDSKGSYLSSLMNCEFYFTLIYPNTYPNILCHFIFSENIGKCNKFYPLALGITARQQMFRCFFGLVLSFMAYLSVDLLCSWVGLLAATRCARRRVQGKTLGTLLCSVTAGGAAHRRQGLPSGTWRQQRVWMDNKSDQSQNFIIITFEQMMRQDYLCSDDLTAHITS